MDRDAYERGSRSYFLNKGKNNNPYDRSDPRFNDFERGWTQACKRAPVDGFSSPGWRNSYSDFGGSDEPKKVSKILKNHYRDLKG